VRDNLRAAWHKKPRDQDFEATLQHKIETMREAYIDLLTEVGFKFNFWSEDLINEDTGEIVSVPRVEIFKLLPNENPA
jgi:hypothetical protein